MIEYDVDRIKEVWVKDVRSRIEELKNVNFTEYLCIREERIRRFNDFFLDELNIESIEDFLQNYKDTYQVFYDFASIDFLLDEPDPFGLIFGSRKQLKNAWTTANETSIALYVNQYFEDKETEFPYPLSEKLRQKLYVKRNQYQVIKEHQLENRKIYYTYDQKIFDMDLAFISILNELNIETFDFFYLTLDEKLGKLKASAILSPSRKHLLLHQQHR